MLFPSTTAIVTAAMLVIAIKASPAPLTPEPRSGNLQKRAVRDCATSVDYSGTYIDNEGTYIDSDDVRRGLGWKCWNDYFLVEQHTYMAPWTKSTGDIYCSGSGTSICSSQIVNGSQECYSHTESVSATIGLAAMGLSASLGVTFSDDAQQCYTGSVATTCTWDDKECHTVWTQQQMVHQVSLQSKLADLRKVDVLH